MSLMMWLLFILVWKIDQRLFVFLGMESVLVCGLSSMFRSGQGKSAEAAACATIGGLYANCPSLCPLFVFCHNHFLLNQLKSFNSITRHWEYIGLFLLSTGSLLPNVFKSHAWGILHTLLEMFSYRLHHIQPHYRVTLLSHLHSLAAVPHTNQNQLHLW